MKHTLFTLLAVLFFGCSMAQPPLSTRIDNNRAYSAGIYLTPGFCPTCVTRLIEGKVHDSTFALMKLITAGACVCPLQDVLDNGNSASDASGGNNGFSLQQVSGGYNGVYSPKDVQYLSGFTSLAKLSGGNGSQPFLQLKDLTSGFSADLKSATFTSSNKTYYLPNEPAGLTMAQASLVTHLTENTIIVGGLAFPNTFTSSEMYHVRSATSTLAKLSSSLGSGFLQMRDAGAGNLVTYTGNPLSGSLSANRTLYPPDESGTIVTHLTKDDILVQVGSNTGQYSSNNLSFNDGGGLVSSINQTDVNISNSAGGITNTVDLAKDALTFNFSDAGTSTSLLQTLNINNLPVGGSSAAYSTYLPLRSGNLGIDLGGTYTTTLTAATLTIVPITGAAGYTGRHVTLMAKNNSTGAILAASHWITNITNSNFQINWTAPQSGNFDITFQVY